MDLSGIDPLMQMTGTCSLQEREVVVTRNTEQVADTGLLETAKQEVANFHACGATAGHCCYLSPLGR